VLECVANLSEGRDGERIDALTASAGPALLDVHRDADHHRCVMTVGGPPEVVEEAVRDLAAAAVARLDLRQHQGAHPRIGVLDVVPFVALCGSPLRDGDPAPAVAARDRFVAWAGAKLGLPCFAYGEERTLPEVRRGAFHGLSPTSGPVTPHPTAGAAAVGARPLLVAYNLWLAEPDLERARQLARLLRGTDVRALGLAVGAGVQVSCNLIRPCSVGPGAVFDVVASRAEVARAELVGLVPSVVLDAEPRHRWRELDLDPSATIEARLEEAGLDGGSRAPGG
jgi:glutamate formiminotransferase